MLSQQRKLILVVQWPLLSLERQLTVHHWESQRPYFLLSLICQRPAVVGSSIPATMVNQNSRLDVHDQQIDQLQQDVTEIKASLTLLNEDRLESGEFRKVVLNWMKAHEKTPVDSSGTSGVSGGGTFHFNDALWVQGQFPDTGLEVKNFSEGAGIDTRTVAGAREAFFYDVPSVSMSYDYDWVGGTSSVDDFTLAAEACLPLINAILVEIKNKTYPQKCFLNVELPTNILKHKGYKLTKQGNSISKMGWKQVLSDAQGGHMLSTMINDPNSAASNVDVKVASQDNLLFKREVKGGQVENGDTDYCFLKDGYITVSPLGALSHADIDCQTFFKEWLPEVAEHTSSAFYQHSGPQRLLGLAFDPEADWLEFMPYLRSKKVESARLLSMLIEEPNLQGRQHPS
ncbi:hypothetical protein E3N88_39969 [Mikania micrantha]|uniref:Survival protein SurE-like phosphatase/nucleotidase domain-containing protein n=1 Tax=Mikania micrantha TaxID=192012 RepID=A0A5N6LLB7_9ASTR|nr:hypothetical protein E3N88_39969 [Mikania micrantha]